MDILNNHLYVSILAFMIIALVVYMLKPKCFFNESRLKLTGLGKDKTLFSYPVIMIVIAIFIYVILSCFSN